MVDHCPASHAATGPAPQPQIASLADLAARISSPGLDAVREIYDVQTVAASKLCMNSAGWTATSAVMGLPRAAVENQMLHIVRDRHTGQEAIVNSLRAKRTGQAQRKLSPTTAVSPQTTCRWCAEWSVKEADLWRDAWETARSADGRIATRPNWARQSPISGLAFGDERMHHLDALTEPEFVGLFTTGEHYLAMAQRSRPAARFCTLFFNGGPKSASSVEHAHTQIVAREDRHFSFPEMIADRCPMDYWQRVQHAHAQAGLTILTSDCQAWVSLAPVKERDVTVLSDNVADGARCIYRIWRSLARQGTRNFSLAAIPSPGYFTAHDDCPARFARWPRVVWRFVDRGDPDVRHADIGTLELFGSPVVANDPYAVAQFLRE
jgi:hypothetical protein